MHAVLGNYGSVEDFNGVEQAIIPGINFTCSGSIESWTFGARWEQDTDFIELQIWRPGSEDGSYTKVGSTSINVEEEGQTDLYHYPLSSPLHFQAGDIVGYYRQMRLNFERVGAGHPLYYTRPSSAASQFSISDPQTNYVDQYHVLISVTTDAPGCECGFMSLERMRLLLRLDTVGYDIRTDYRQQITPDIRFTCDGMITKWIVGADWKHYGYLYPEVQLWMNSGNDVYQKINGTYIDIETENEERVYEYDNFPPIPFQAGDILGVFIPRGTYSRLRLMAEGHGPTNYYILTADTVSPYDSIDLQQDTPQVSSSVYHPLVTVEVVTTQISPMTTGTPVTTLPPPPPPETIATQVSPMTTPANALTTPATALPPPVTTLPPPVTTLTTPVPTPTSPVSALSSEALYISVGVSGVVVVLIAAAVIVISVTVCLRKRKSKHLNTFTDNVAYGVSEKEMELSTNAAYTTTCDSAILQDNADTYDYVATTDISIITAPNKAFVKTSDIPVSSNQAYGMVDHIYD